MHTPLSVRMATISRKLKAGWLGTVSLATTVLLAALVTAVGLGGPAGAVPPPTPAQAQKMLIRLNKEATALGQQYARVIQQLVFANQWLKTINKQAAVYRATVGAMRKQVAKLAVVAYEQGDLNSPLALLLTASPQHLLDQASILNELAGADTLQIRQYLNAN